MKWLFVCLALCHMNAHADYAPTEIQMFLDGAANPDCGVVKVLHENSGDFLLYGISNVTNGTQEHSFNAVNAFNEHFATQYSFELKDHLETLHVATYALAEGGSWSPDRPGIIWGVTKFTFKIVKDLNRNKIISIEKHELIRRKTIFGTLRKDWKEESHWPSCSGQ